MIVLFKILYRRVNMYNNVSPLRYPGGKTKLYPYIKDIIQYNNLTSSIYIEPFAGGCGLALKLLMNNDVKSIILNDFDYAIYAFWYSILNDPDAFCEKIEGETINLEQWHLHKMIYNNQSEFSLFEVGFSTFFLNRTNRSGILNGGIIGGVEQKGKYTIDCRFNKEILIKKILQIKKYRDKIQLYNLDVVDFIDNVINMKNNVFTYFDPPYVKKGKQLYKNYFDFNNHDDLKRKIESNIKTPWLVTYDKHPEIGSLYKAYYQEEISINYSAGTNKRGKEIAIFSNNVKSPKEKTTEYQTNVKNMMNMKEACKKNLDFVIV